MQFAAVCMPFVMTLPEGVVAYVAGDVAECGADVVAAGDPVVLAAENGTYAIGVGGEAQDVEVVNQLDGVLKSANVSGSNVYTLNGGVFTKRSAAKGTIKANTAYYTADSEVNTLELKEGDVTSVDFVVTEGEPVKFYDFKGNLVEKPVRGIYVTSDGVKVLVK